MLVFNVASVRVLEKCGFAIVETTSRADRSGQIIEDALFELG